MSKLSFKSAQIDTDYTKVFIKTSDIEQASLLIKELGGKITTTLKTILIAEIPFAALNTITEFDYISYIEASHDLLPQMNFAKSLTKVEEVHSGSGLSQAYEGGGVYVGLIDTGIDCAHEDFGGLSNSRIFYLWDQNLNVEYTPQDIADGTCRYSPDDIILGHGTHVAGIMAGSNSTYKGVAPEAHIIAVEAYQTSLYSSYTSTGIVEGAQYVFNKAASAGVPVVLNLSMGNSYGAHDGTSLFEQSFDELLDGYTGRAIVASAGNSTANPNDTNCYTSSTNYTCDIAGTHAQINVDGTDTGYEYFIRETDFLGFFLNYFLIDIWLQADSNCGIELDIFPFDSKTNPAANMSTVYKGENNYKNRISVGDMQAYIDFTDDDNTQNGMQHAVAYVLLTDGGTSPIDYIFDLVFRDNGGGCQGHAWGHTSPSFAAFLGDFAGTVNTNGGYTYAMADDNYSITLPATADSVIAVGSYSARNAYTDIDGTLEYQNEYGNSINGTGTNAGAISLYSSLGPGTGSLNGQKPDITAPGEPIISSMSSSFPQNDWPTRGELGDSTHVKLYGTSMASPHVAGIVALMLQKNRCLTSNEIRSVLRSSAISVTGEALPNYTWGYGKVNAQAAMQAIQANSDCSDDGDGSSGKGGCSLIIR